MCVAECRDAKTPQCGNLFTAATFYMINCRIKTLKLSE